MARRPYFRKACRAWYVFHAGKQVRLGRTKREADLAWRSLLAGSNEPAQSGVTAKELADQFLEWVRANRAPLTHTVYGQFIRPFLAHVGSIRASDLRPFHVTRWLSQQSYGSSTANCAVRALMRCFNWCDKEGLFRPNPISGVERPPATPREVYITRDQWAAVLSLVSEGDTFRDLLLMLWETGCRPQEVRAIAARHFDPASVLTAVESGGGGRPKMVALGG